MISSSKAHYKPKYLRYYVNNIAPKYILKMVKIQRKIGYLKNESQRLQHTFLNN